MENPKIDGTLSKPRSEAPDLYRVIPLCCAVLLFLMVQALRLGAMDLARFLPPPTWNDQDGTVQNAFPKRMQELMEDLVDAFLYLGPQDLRLWEKAPVTLFWMRTT
jgi:hypothetical protein